MDYLTDQLMELYSPETLKTEGLSIFTTIDTQVQSAAEEALDKGLAYLENAHPKLKRQDPKKTTPGRRHRHATPNGVYHRHGRRPGLQHKSVQPGRPRPTANPEAHLNPSSI